MPLVELDILCLHEPDTMTHQFKSTEKTMFMILEVKKKKKINEGTRAKKTWASTGLKVVQETLAYEEQKY